MVVVLSRYANSQACQGSLFVSCLVYRPTVSLCLSSTLSSSLLQHFLFGLLLFHIHTPTQPKVTFVCVFPLCRASRSLSQGSSSAQHEKILCETWCMEVRSMSKPQTQLKTNVCVMRLCRVFKVNVKKKITCTYILFEGVSAVCSTSILVLYGCKLRYHFLLVGWTNSLPMFGWLGVSGRERNQIPHDFFQKDNIFILV